MSLPGFQQCTGVYALYTCHKSGSSVLSAIYTHGNITPRKNRIHRRKGQLSDVLYWRRLYWSRPESLIYFWTETWKKSWKTHLGLV